MLTLLASVADKDASVGRNFFCLRQKIVWIEDRGGEIFCLRQMIVWIEVGAVKCFVCAG